MGKRISIYMKWQLRTFEGIAIFVLLAYGIVFLPVAYITHYEGTLSPVITELEFTHNLEVLDVNKTKVRGQATRLRDCSYLSAQWHLGRVGSQNALTVPVRFTDKPQIREKGLTSWEGIIVGLTPEEIIHNSHATVKYHCHKYFGLWEDAVTTVIWYRGNGQDVGWLPFH